MPWNAKKIAAKPALGRCLIRSKNTARKNGPDLSQRHTDELEDGYDWAKSNVRSITEESNLQEFLTTAELAGTEFNAEKENIKFIDPATDGILTESELLEQEQFQEDNKGYLCVPRRPYWDLYTTSEELLEREKKSFLAWRKSLAKIQEENDVVFTPFEKNLEFWRQLWRVVERSDVVTQIADARNPLLFYCEDLKTYVNEVSDDKVNLLLLNKSDYLTEAQRETWAKYFDSVGVKAVFFSALDENDLLDKLEEDGNADERTPELIDGFSLDSKNSSKLLTGSELIAYFKSIEVKKVTTVSKKYVTIGLVGYPNVGKSSCINAILKTKKVSVSVTPGKTKHFQTILVDDELCLCDCPGLVFPNFVTTKAEMVTNGILPIDQLIEHVPPVNIVASLIPRHLFESMYGIILPRDTGSVLTSDELLNSYGYMRGFMTARGLPDNPRAARYILKDFVSGKLLYCKAPPGVDQKTFHIYSDRVREQKEMTMKQKRIMDPKPSDEDFDEKFFEKRNVKAHTNGAYGVSGYVRHSHIINHEGTSTLAPGATLPPKSWKKHNNRKKKEKSRVTFAHLDY